MSIPKVEIAVLKNLLIFGEKYLPQGIRLLERGGGGGGGENAIWPNSVWTCSILTRCFPRASSNYHPMKFLCCPKYKVTIEYCPLCRISQYLSRTSFLLYFPPPHPPPPNWLQSRTMQERRKTRKNLSLSALQKFSQLVRPRKFRGIASSLC